MKFSDLFSARGNLQKFVESAINLHLIKNREEGDGGRQRRLVNFAKEVAPLLDNRIFRVLKINPKRKIFNELLPNPET